MAKEVESNIGYYLASIGPITVFAVYVIRKLVKDLKNPVDNALSLVLDALYISVFGWEILARIFATAFVEPTPEMPNEENYRKLFKMELTDLKNLDLNLISAQLFLRVQLVFNFGQYLTYILLRKFVKILDEIYKYDTSLLIYQYD